MFCKYSNNKKWYWFSKVYKTNKRSVWNWTVNSLLNYAKFSSRKCTNLQNGSDDEVPTHESCWRDSPLQTQNGLFINSILKLVLFGLSWFSSQYFSSHSPFFMCVVRWETFKINNFHWIVCLRIVIYFCTSLLLKKSESSESKNIFI